MAANLGADQESAQEVSRAASHAPERASVAGGRGVPVSDAAAWALALMPLAYVLIAHFARGLGFVAFAVPPAVALALLIWDRKLFEKVGAPAPSNEHIAITCAGPLVFGILGEFVYPAYLYSRAKRTHGSMVLAVVSSALWLIVWLASLIDG